MWEIVVGIGSIALGILQFVFFCWLTLFILGGILGSIMDPYYGLPEDKHRKKLIAKRKKRGQKNEM